MNEIEDVTELAICSDISTRMAMFALAKSCNEEELGLVFEIISGSLCNAYEKEKVQPLIEIYKAGTMNVKHEV